MIYVVFDDSGRKSEVIQDIIGDKGFSDVVVKKRRLEEYYREELSKFFSNMVWRKVHSLFEYPDVIKEIEGIRSNIKVIHCFSDYLILDSEKALLAYRKLDYIESTYGVIENGRAVAAMFPNADEYIEFCQEIIDGQKAWDIARHMKDTFEIEGLVNIGSIGNFIQCITGNFDSRYFNSLKGNEYTLVKTSSDKRKIKAEYTFYHLLPEDMRYWFVEPFNYIENDNCASYTMERLHMTDLAIKWVHGSMDEKEFGDLLDKYFYFFSCRHSKKCSYEEYQKITDALYEEKVTSRIHIFKENKDYPSIAGMLKAANGMNIDNLVARYREIKAKIVGGLQNKEYSLVIGHGDPCFSNALYNKATKTLKFIDPKGALTEEELWTEPYYDIAKLSHSICGRYDFFNNGLFEIKVGSSFDYELEIPFDNRIFVELFRKKVIENGYDFRLIRIYEASLFLSMLPLHMDNPHKVLGFILNVRNILKEVESYV